MSDEIINLKLSDIENLKIKLNTFRNEDNKQKLKIKELEDLINEKEKNISDLSTNFENSKIKINSLNEDIMNLKLELKKSELKFNNPIKILSVMQKEINKNEIENEKAELKEINEKLILFISEKQNEFIKDKKENENLIIELNNKIIELSGKISDLEIEKLDLENLLKNKEKELMKNEENKNILIEFQKLNFEYEQLQIKLINKEEINKKNEQLLEQYKKDNNNLKEKLNKIEKEFNNLIKSGKITIEEMTDLNCYIIINENLRDQIKSLEEENEIKEKNLISQIENLKENYKILDNKFLNSFNEKEELQKNLENIQTEFINGTNSLNKQISDLNDINNELKNNKKNADERIQKLLDYFTNIQNDFKNIEETLKKNKEKDDFNIVFIEEKIISFENIMEIEKQDLIRTNNNLLNKIKFLENEKLSSVDYLIDEENLNSHKLEIKNLNDEIKNLKKKIEEDEIIIENYQKNLEELKICQNQIKSLKSTLNDSNNNYQSIIQQLTEKLNLTNEELLNTRKKNNYLISLPKFSEDEINLRVEKIIMNNNYNKLKKENEFMKENIINKENKFNEEIQKYNDQISTLKAQYASENFNKENEIIKFKSLVKKYKDLCIKNNLIKQKK